MIFYMNSFRPLDDSSAAPLSQSSVLFPELSVFDHSDVFHFDPVALAKLTGSWDDPGGMPESDRPQMGSNRVQAKRGSVKRSNTRPDNSTFRKKRMLTTDSIMENIPKEDIKSFQDYADVQPGIVHFLFTFKKKYESFKKLFELNDMLITPYEILQSSGFVFLQIMNILHPSGGYKNLEALQALTIKAADQDQTPLQQLQAAGFEPTHIVSILANNGGYKNLEALLNFIPYYVGLTAPEKTAFLSFVSKAGASTRVALAKRLIELHTDKIDKASLFDFLKNATNKSAVQFEALPLEQLVEQIKPKKAKRVPAGRPQTQTAVAVPIYPFVEGAFGGLAGVPGYNPDAIPKVPDGGQEVVAAQTAEV